ncbi:MurR/RpiR family transcriptional regulator [Flavitalea sp. BT771]|uniref:MurR/RpiR family transcriptional regulator n=1 Tax=Flavitalea sp. BT771 TaxID=3063329 RepID=UPI0026E280BA|nr:MurR/RpiR family transcriptional regulator [Flavitalea sp. BT771]MDO6435215.1 MurR/RpiR family transcriptional regulator [Flavitalea sp. BT771]MDV6224080.1 MurR/RpiR family transcriptional regulator [Flavitalea sp. BT771]
MDFLKGLDLELLPKKKYRVIKYVLDHPEEIISMNTSDLAKKLKVDPVTIIKACQGIGLEGFHDLKKRLKEKLMRTDRKSSFSQVLSEFAVSTSTDEAIRNALSRDLEMLSRTIEKVSFEKIMLACQAIIGSRQTYIIGLGYIGNVANYLQSLLRSHLPQTHAITEYNGMLFDYMGHFGKGDVVLAIGFDQCQNQTIKALKKAKEKGATTIALTDSEYSPLCAYSRHELFVHPAPNYFLSPLIGAFSICNAIKHCIVEMTKPQSTRQSAAYKKLVEEENVYYN